MVGLPWWTAIAPATATRKCSGAVHELRWERGRLLLGDHDDIDAEAALGALGARTPSCLRIARAWAQLADDPVLVTLGRRPGEATIGLGDRPPPGARTADLEQPTRRDQLLLLFTLPPPFIDRLVLTAAAAAAARWPDPTFRAAYGLRLGAALAARATPALRRFGGELAGPGEALVVHATPAGPGERGTVRAERSGDALEVAASLPLEWVSTVWGSGISEPAGHMVLAVRPALPDGIHGGEGPAARLGVDVAAWLPDGTDRWEAVRVPGILHRPAVDAPWALDLTED